ncbi:MAG TPA: roadblock/LC7 domain-containing protein [Herpetosiphonaceae bacterium]
MGLHDVLTDAIDSVPGAKLAGIVGTDGLGVEMALRDVDEDFDSSLAEIEIGGLASAAAAAVERMQGGQMRDLIVEAEQLTYLASQILPGYYAVLGLSANGNLGRARFAMRQLVTKLQETM